MIKYLQCYHSLYLGHRMWFVIVINFPSMYNVHWDSRNSLYISLYKLPLNACMQLKQLWIWCLRAEPPLACRVYTVTIGEEGGCVSVGEHGVHFCFWETAAGVNPMLQSKREPSSPYKELLSLQPRGVLTNGRARLRFPVCLNGSRSPLILKYREVVS